MIQRSVLRRGAVLLLAALASPSQATDWWGKTIDAVLIDTRACTFLTLSGVSQADPVTPGSPHFALAKAHPNYAELNAVLLTAKVSQRTVDVSTTGQVVCGHAEVMRIVLHGNEPSLTGAP